MQENRGLVGQRFQKLSTGQLEGQRRPRRQPRRQRDGPKRRLADQQAQHREGKILPAGPLPQRGQQRRRRRQLRLHLERAAKATGSRARQPRAQPPSRRRRKRNPPARRNRKKRRRRRESGGRRNRRSRGKTRNRRSIRSSKAARRAATAQARAPRIAAAAVARLPPYPAVKAQPPARTSAGGRRSRRSTRLCAGKTGRRGSASGLWRTDQWLGGRDRGLRGG
jgi:hypothetical protein